MTTRDFWLGLTVGFWIGAVMGTLTMAVRAEEQDPHIYGTTCPDDGGYGAGYHCRMQADQRRLREVLEYVPPKESTSVQQSQCYGMDGAGHLVVELRCDRPIDCADKMEAAMRALEKNKWILLNRSTNLIDPIAEVSAWIVLIDKAHYEQWADAKRACWRTP